MGQGVGGGDEDEIARELERRGYRVLDTKEPGFPDFIVLEGKTIRFFVAVRGKERRVGGDARDRLEAMGFQVETAGEQPRRKD